MNNQVIYSISVFSNVIVCSIYNNSKKMIIHKATAVFFKLLLKLISLMMFTKI